MKVCFVNALFYPFRGGTENHMLELGSALARQGVEVHVVTSRLKGTKKTESINGVKIHRIPAKFYKIKGLYPPPLVVCPNFLRYLREIDAREKFDLFHLHSRWFPDFTLVRRYCLGTGKPLVLTVHNARPIGINPAYSLFGSAYEAAVGKKVLRSADQLIAVSSWTRNDVLKYKLDKSNFTVIHNGLDASRFSTKHSPNVKKKLGMKKSDALLIWVGRIVEQKGLRYLIEAMPRVLQHTSAKLLLVGSGSEAKKLQKQIRSLGIAKAVVFYGEVNNRKELNDLLRGSDVFVFP
ncbi:glycosyltransferase family 4 protein, partial [Candidatus Micrarchaeota archaeon]|nr:glycosyltransferase family 4 protein [Candidatus Micrarchaeota archaeon]